MRVLYALAVLGTLIGSPALAQSESKTEFVLGIQGGYAETDAELSVGSVSASDKESGGTYGVFGQVNYKLQDNWFVGLHLGFSGDSTEYEGSASGLSASLSYGYLIDIMPRLGLDLGTNRPFVTAGVSFAEIEFAGSVTQSGRLIPFDESETLTGWKIGAGLDVPFGDTVLAHALLHYADYSDETFFGGIDVGGSQYGISVGVGWRF